MLLKKPLPLVPKIEHNIQCGRSLITVALGLKAGDYLCCLCCLKPGKKQDLAESNEEALEYN